MYIRARLVVPNARRFAFIDLYLTEVSNITSRKTRIMLVYIDGQNRNEDGMQLEVMMRMGNWIPRFRESS